MIAMAQPSAGTYSNILLTLADQGAGLDHAIVI